MKEYSVLIIDDDVDMCLLLGKLLTRKGYFVEAAHSGNKGVQKFKAGHFDIVLCDFRLGDKDGKEVLTEIKAHAPDTIVLIITGYSDIKVAVDVIKLGAYDYITKPLIPDEVVKVLNDALNGQSQHASGLLSVPLKLKTTSHKQVVLNDEYLVGEAGATQELYRQIEIVAPTNYSIILYGESGTGKEVIAKTIHSLSERANKPFVAMDCETLSNELAGSELFGHVKGAFTGAMVDKEGHFEMADGGTLFLDEVANLSYEVQASLLRVIQERKFKRVGGNKEMPVDIRIIVASNENLQDAYKKGKFREDLYHRFNEFSINLPALRNRKKDIPLFADFFLQRSKEELGRDVGVFEDDVMQMFINYSWPGNLREFRNVVRRSVLLTNDGNISAKTLPWEIMNSFDQPDQSDQPVMSQRPEPSFENNGFNLKNAASKAEYEAIIKVLKEVNFNKTRAAEILRIDRKTLYNKIKSYESANNQ